MDSIFFAVKRAHHAVLRFTRPMLEEFGLTPARFDLMFALAEIGSMTQSALRMSLGVARATISEMLGSLERIGLIARARCWTDRRTWQVSLTKRGRDALQAAGGALVDGGHVPVTVDAVLARNRVEIDPFEPRSEVVGYCSLFRAAFGDFAKYELYPWHPDSYGAALLELNDESVLHR